MKIEWSPRAERELTQLRDYIAQDSPIYVCQFIERLVLAIERLACLPRSGRTVRRPVTRVPSENCSFAAIARSIAFAASNSCRYCLPMLDKTRSAAILQSLPTPHETSP